MLLLIHYLDRKSEVKTQLKSVQEVTRALSQDTATTYFPTKATNERTFVEFMCCFLLDHFMSKAKQLYMQVFVTPSQNTNSQKKQKKTKRETKWNPGKMGHSFFHPNKFTPEPQSLPQHRQIFTGQLRCDSLKATLTEKWNWFWMRKC